ncbi:MAG: PepSY domain-containing protein [Gammaproteobacteria bacterium]
MKLYLTAPLVVATTLLSAAAFAAPDCTKAPQDQWMPEATMKQKILDQGYTIKVFKVSGNCYEIYGKDKDGKNVEIYFDPTDGRIVKQR